MMRLAPTAIGVAAPVTSVRSFTTTVLAIAFGLFQQLV